MNEIKSKYKREYKKPKLFFQKTGIVEISGELIK